MGTLKVRADRTAVGLSNLPVVELSNFNNQITLPFEQSLDDAAYSLVQRVTFTPSGTTTDPGNIPPGTPPPGPSGKVLYDSTVNSKLHDGKTRTITKEGSTSAGGKGFETSASGNPRVRVNSDKTFSLLVDGSGRHGRIYFFIKNFNAIMDIEAAFWNDQGQDCSLRLRSRHGCDSSGCTHGGGCENQFGGYGFVVDRKTWSCKLETCHGGSNPGVNNNSDGKLTGIETKKYFTVNYIVRNESGGVRNIGVVNGKQVFNGVHTGAKPYMMNKSLYDQNSYIWVRQNSGSSTSELRIKRLRILQA